MDRMIYLAMSGANQITRAQTVNANNLANVSTQGFRADLEAVQARPVYGTGYASRAYSETYQSGVDLSAGTLMSTGRELDIALSDKGYLAVTGPDGREAYTRAGNLRITANGQLVTANGYAVLGNGGPIAVPPSEKIDIGVDGTITVKGTGQSAAALSVVDRLRLVSPDPKLLGKSEHGLLVLPENSAVPSADAGVRVSSGMLETSNVNAVGSMMRMIELARQFEMNVKLMQTAQQNDTATAQLLRMT